MMKYRIFMQNQLFSILFLQHTDISYRVIDHFVIYRAIYKAVQIITQIIDSITSTFFYLQGKINFKIIKESH